MQHLIRDTPVHRLHHGTVVVEQLLMAQQDSLGRDVVPDVKIMQAASLRLHLAFSSCTRTRTSGDFSRRPKLSGLIQVPASFSSR